MLQRTSGIILHSTKYAESALIVKIFTREYGLQSCIINSSRKKGGKGRVVFQPLAIVDLVLSDSGRTDLKRITEFTNTYAYSDIPFNVIKGSIVMFINEVLYRSLKESHPDAEMFDFIRGSLQVLDLRTDTSSDFHLCFMLQLSRYLGFYPQGRWTDRMPVFDLLEGRFTDQLPLHAHYLASDLSETLDALLHCSYDSLTRLKISNDRRKQLLEAMITFYKLHISSMGEIRSHKILEEVIS